MWHSGSGKPVSIEEILECIYSHTRKNGSVYLGCDSQLYGEKCTFSTVVCLHGADNQNGGYYFFRREKENSSSYPTMLTRLLKEVELSVELGYQILEQNPKADIAVLKSI